MQNAEAKFTDEDILSLTAMPHLTFFLLKNICNLAFSYKFANLNKQVIDNLRFNHCKNLSLNLMKKLKMLLLASFIISTSVYCQNNSKSGDSNGYKEFILDSDISLYKNVISKDEYLERYKDDTSIQNTPEYKSVKQASPIMVKDEYCKVWVYTGHKKKSIDKDANSVILSTYQNKIVAIQVHHNNNRSVKNDSSIEYFVK